jgi:ribosomal-protein-serine acetyltransferase
MSNWPESVVCRVDDLELRILRESDCAGLSGLSPGDLSCSQGEWAFAPNNPLPWVEAGLQALSEETGFRAGIWQDETLVGIICLEGVHTWNRSADLTFALDSRFRGQGIMTRACRSLCDFAFGELPLNRLQIECDIDNEPSRAIAERLGFTLEGIIRDRYRSRNGFRNCGLYSLLVREWNAIRSEQSHGETTSKSAPDGASSEAAHAHRWE